MGGSFCSESSCKNCVNQWRRAVCNSLPLCLDPLGARLVEELGFDAVYIGGSALGYGLSVSEALITMDELVGLTAKVCQRVSVP